MLVSMKEMLNKAYQQHYAVGQFNINNLEWVAAVLKTAKENRSAAILGVSGGTIKHMLGFKTIYHVVREGMEYLDIDVPIALHLDHGQSYESCISAIKAGFSSVMFDGSHLPFSENLEITKRVVDYAQNRGISVEAELGTIAGSEDGIVNSKVIYADVDQCVKLVQQTHVDCLAAALGSTHGLYKGKAKLGFEEMKNISNLINIPLVLHGGTGISDEDMIHAIKLGTAKINVNTENMYTWCLEVQRLFAEQGDKDINDPRKVINLGLEPVAKKIKDRMVLFGSNNRY